MPFYAVARGRSVGIYNTWPECQAMVKGFANARYKKFGTTQEAESFIEEHKAGGNSTGGGAPAKGNGVQSTVPARGKKRKNPTAEVEEPGSSTSSSTPDDSDQIVIYTDGCCLSNGKLVSKAGIGAYFGENDARNICKRLKGPQTNNRAEIHACIEALRTVIKSGDSHRPVVIRTDSQFVINCMTKWIKGWVKHGWITATGAPVKNQADLRKLHEIYRKLRVKWEYVPGHTGILGNERADQLAKEGAEKPYKCGKRKKKRAKLGAQGESLNESSTTTSASDFDSDLSAKDFVPVRGRGKVDEFF